MEGGSIKTSHLGLVLLNNLTKSLISFIDDFESQFCFQFAAIRYLFSNPHKNTQKVFLFA